MPQIARKNAFAQRVRPENCRSWMGRGQHDAVALVFVSRCGNSLLVSLCAKAVGGSAGRDGCGAESTAPDALSALSRCRHAGVRRAGDDLPLGIDTKR